MSDIFSLAGKTVLVTGGTRGIGRAISRQLAGNGAEVIANYVRDQKAADSLQAEARSAEWKLTLCRADLTTDAGLERLMVYVNKNCPRLTTLVYCAATGVHKPFAELTSRHFDWTFALNVRAFFALVQRLLSLMEQGSSILAVSSLGADRAVFDYSIVGSSKGALESLARHLAVELAPRGIRVNVLAPGSVVTDFWKAMPAAEARLAAEAQRTPLKRLVSLDEVAQTAHFLCSDAASGIVGQTVVVDGGYRVVG
jgi:NAD(P)-dependent dehydrogenase (short-subunit alcohol dehydrogenase family)